MPSFPTPGIQRRWKALPGEPVGDAGDPYTGYDRFGRVERMRWVQPQEDSSFLPLVDVAWGYGRASQKTWRRDALAPASTGQDQHFGYDGLYQVTERQRGLLNTNTTAVGAIPAQQENFGYDQTGNWQSYRQQNDGVLGIEESRVNNRSNQITQVDGSSAGVSYDKNGNMLEVPTGEGLTGPSRRLEWDAWNRLKRVFDAEDNLMAEYEYDGLGRRTTETVGGVTRNFYYDDQWRVVEERLDEATTAERQYVWHPSDRWELILRDRSTGNDGMMDERLYPLKDQLDPVALCDASGAVVERYAYSAFGLPSFLNPDFTPKEDNSSSFDWNFLFHAEFADTSTGWFDYGFRYYVPALGRWLSRDPIEERVDANLFAFVVNDAINYIDYLGKYHDIYAPGRNCETFRISKILIDDREIRVPGLGSAQARLEVRGEVKRCKYFNDNTPNSGTCCKSYWDALLTINGRLQGRGRTPWTIPIFDIGIFWTLTGEASGSLKAKYCDGKFSGDLTGSIRLLGGLQASVSKQLQVGGDIGGGGDIHVANLDGNEHAITGDLEFSPVVSARVYATYNFSRLWQGRYQHEWTFHGDWTKLGSFSIPLAGTVT